MCTSRILIALLLAAIALSGERSAAQSLTFSLFERYLEALREQSGIPGLSAAIVQGRRIVWEKGFGLAEIERSVRAEPYTPYPVIDLTQTVAATLLLHRMEKGYLDLDDKIQRWTSEIPEGDATVRQVLTHTTASTFQYDPKRYAAITPIIGYYFARQPYRRVLTQEVLDRLGMTESVPGPDLSNPSPADRQLFDQSTLDRYAAVLQRMAVPYKVDSRLRPTRSEYRPTGVDAASGLVSTVRDLARYDAALDDGILLRADWLNLAWSTATSRNGAALPVGLGWFVQAYNRDHLVWHFGLARDAYSSLILKVRSRDITLILLANSDGLSAPFALEAGDVTRSLFAKLFLNIFVT